MIITNRGEGPFFFVEGVGIKPGDSFIFYHRDLETANTTNAITFDNLEILKENTSDGVFGGFIFSCHSRGESYFGESDVDITPFYSNFPGVPLAGVFCKGEIGRGSSAYITQEEYEEQSPRHCCIHACSAVYMVMSYVPAPSVTE